MGQFTNTKYTDTLDAIVDINKNVIKNPYYLFNNKFATSTTYYHINTEKSMMDESSRIPYSNIGKDSPFRFNKIINMYLYGIEKIELLLDNSDQQGFSAAEISGEAYILPSTIIPIAGDYFTINYLKNDLLFKVMEINRDTLDDGSNFWKISYIIDRNNTVKIKDLVVEEYRMIVNNVGTNFNAIISSTKYDLIKELETLCSSLKQYYIEMFYNDRVQTFIFYHFYMDRFYDPFMIEFLIRNKILNNPDYDNFIYVQHQLSLHRTFSLDYDTTFFKCLEDNDIDKFKKCRFITTADYIDNMVSIFNTRPENYYKINYTFFDKDIRTPMYSLPLDLYNNICNNRLYETNKKYLNIIIRYMNNGDINKSDIESVSDIEYNDSIELFYEIPIIIFILEKYIKKLLNSTYE